MYTSLKLFGHVNDRPHQHINRSFSAPLGMTQEEVRAEILAFGKAFTMLKAEYK
jgi:hypothetical protein